jgi:hypothetical protein
MEGGQESVWEFSGTNRAINILENKADYEMGKIFWGLSVFTLILYSAALLSWLPTPEFKAALQPASTILRPKPV